MAGSGTPRGIYLPTISPASLIPKASACDDPGTLRVVKVPLLCREDVAQTNIGPNFKRLMRLNCPIPMIVSMPPFQPRFMNTSRMFRQHLQSFIGSCVRAAALSLWTQIMGHLC